MLYISSYFLKNVIVYIIGYVHFMDKFFGLYLLNSVIIYYQQQFNKNMNLNVFQSMIFMRIDMK